MEIEIDPDVELREDDFRISPRHKKYLEEQLGAFASYVSDNFSVKTCKIPQKRGRPRKTEKILNIRGWRTIVGYHPSGWHHSYSHTVQHYNTDEDARTGHEKWVKFMRENRNIDPFEFKEWAYPGWIRPSPSSGEKPT